MGTPGLPATRGPLRALSIPCTQRSMICFSRPRTLRRRPRRLWWMQLVWQMNSALSRTTLTPRARLSAHLRPSCPSWSRSLLTPMRTPFEEVAQPWPSLRLASVSWRLSSEMCRPTLEKTPRAIRSLSVAPKADDLMSELEACRCEGRNYSSEVFRLKAGYDETMEQLDVVKRENKNLADEIKDLLDQLGDGGRSIHELDKQRRRLEVEKEELQAALEEAESALEAEENKVLRAQLELGQVKQDVDRKIAEKEEEFNNTRKNHSRAMDSMQASLESEQGAKAEGLRIKKKLEGEINELEIALDHANKANSEAQKA